MDHRITAEERAAYKRCRRQWDLSSVHRQGLEPVEPAPDGVAAALRAALAVYYYPGMWDWPSAIVLPLVRKAFMRAIAGQPTSAQRTENLDVGSAVLERYLDWAPSLDDFGPVRIDHEVEATVPDPADPEQGLRAPDGRRVAYVDSVDLLVIDGYDRYWVLCHRVVPTFSEVRDLVLDERSVAACWAWEETYLGMDVVGTIHSEILLAAPAGPAPAGTRTGRHGRGGYPQHEGSGGGRMVAQGQRRPGLPEAPELERVTVATGGMVRRTAIRRSRSEIEAMSRGVAYEMAEMCSGAPLVYPTPGPHCRDCEFVEPCLTMVEGGDPTPELAARYRARPVGYPAGPRLGSPGGNRGGLLPPA